MAKTTRQNILDNIKTVLERVSGLRQVSVGKISAVDVEKVAFPCCFVFAENELKAEPKSDLVETWIWNVGLEIWSKEDSMETMLGAVHTEMNLDRTRGGYALFCERISSDFLVVDTSRFIVGMSLTYEIKYRHAVGTP